MASLTWPMFVADDGKASRFDLDSESTASFAEDRSQLDETEPSCSASEDELEALLDEWEAEIETEGEFDNRFEVPQTWDPLEAPLAIAENEAPVMPPPGVWSKQNVVVEAPPTQHWTTLMIRNVPKRFTLEKLVSLLDGQGFKGAYNLLYVPRDMKTHKNFNYCFVNMVGSSFAEAAMQRFSGHRVGSSVLETQWITDGDGLEAQIEKLRNKPMMHPDVPVEFKPVLFCNGFQVEFPKPTREISLLQFGRQK
jgi:hypothetical protein